MISILVIGIEKSNVMYRGHFQSIYQEDSKLNINDPTISNKNQYFVEVSYAEFGKHITLIKDCKTRLNSLLSVLERVYVLKVACKMH